MRRWTLGRPHNTLVTSQRSAVMSQCWKNVLITGLCKLVISNGLSDHAFAYDLLMDSVVSKVRLETVDVSGPAPEQLYHAIAGVTQLRSLAIEPYLLFSDAAIIGMIQNLDLSSLEIRCPSRPCIFRRREKEERQSCSFLNAVSAHLSNLRALSISCSCWTSYDVAQEMLGIIFALPKSVELHISTTSVAIETIFSRVPHVSKIEFTLVGDRSETTRMMPSSWILVRGVNIRRAQFLDVTALRGLSDLRQVKLEIEDHAERAIKNLPLAKVDALGITGSSSAVKHYENMMVYYAVEHDAIFKAVLSSPLLRDISVIHCQIDRREICGIIRILGLSLRRFETSIFGQTESPGQRMLDLVSTIVEFNSRIERFEITDVLEGGVEGNAAKKMIFGSESLDRHEKLFIAIDSARGMLLKRAHMLDPIPLSKVIASLYPSLANQQFIVKKPAE